MKTKEQIRGLKDLALDAVENGSIAFERVHVATTKRTFDALEQIPQIAAPVRGLHAMHDAALTNAYALVRHVNKVVGVAVDRALGAQMQTPKPPASTRPTHAPASGSVARPVARHRAAS